MGTYRSGFCPFYQFTIEIIGKQTRFLVISSMIFKKGVAKSAPVCYKERSKMRGTGKEGVGPPQREAAAGCKPPWCVSLGSPGSGPRERDGVLRRYRESSAGPLRGRECGWYRGRRSLSSPTGTKGFLSYLRPCGPRLLFASFFVEECFVPPLRGGGGFFLHFTFAPAGAGPSFRASEKKQKVA